MAYLTYFDLVESLIVSSYGGPQDAEQRDIRTAVHKAYSELTTIRDWAYYSVHGRLVTQAPYATGTVTSSGTTVTLTGGTWPSWAATGAFLRVGTETCRVASRTSGTVVVLDEGLGLKANVTAQPFTLYRTVYPLPADFRNLDEPTDEYNWWAGMYLSPDEAMKVERVNRAQGKPYHWTVIKDPDSTGWAIKLIGYPTIQETIDFTYRRSARPLRWSGHETSARIVALSSDSGVANTDDQVMPESIQGAILRVGSSASYPGPITSITPYLSEHLITDWEDTNNFVFSPAADLVAVKAIVTDPIDVAPHMQQAMHSCCEYWLARIRGQKSEAAFGLYQRDLRLAMEQDQLAPLSGRSRRVWHSGGWRSPVRPDTA
jgi:hypothetical protein